MILKQVLLITAIVLITLLLIYVFQRHLIYFPATEQPLRQNYSAEDMTLIKIPVSKDIILSSWYRPSQDKKPTILYLHGNAGHIGYRMPLARSFISAGFGVLLLEYRGYGGNPGKPTESGFYQDGRAAMLFLQQQGVDAHDIVLYGESLGTGVATKLATEFKTCALILQSPYTSLTALARYHYPWLPPLPLMDKYDSLSRIQDIHTPLLIVHGKEDNVVPFQQALTLFEKANQPKEQIEFPTKGHHDLWDDNFSELLINYIHKTCMSTSSEIGKTEKHL